MNDDTRTEWHALFNAVLNGIATDVEQRQLATLLKSSAEARQLWFLYGDNECGLAELNAASRAPATVVRPAFWTARRALAAAAALVFFLGLSALWWSRRGVEMEVLRVSESAVGRWKAGDTMRARHLTWVRGTVEMRLASGVRLKVEAPAVLEFVGPMELRVVAGKVTADVGEAGKGFVIETPETRVVDLGTVFGVDASSTARTDVVVFKGQVELFQKGAKERLALLNQGEGMRVEKNRRASRIVSVTGSDESGSWSAQERPPENAIITAVGNSMSANDEEAKLWPSLRNFYRIVPGGLGDGALAFADAEDEWSNVPDALIGADQVRTFVVDSQNWWMKLTVELSRPCELFVFVDQRNPVPHWVRNEFTDTGKTVTLDFKPSQAGGRVAKQLPYAIWRRVVEKPGAVTLGAPYDNPPADKRSFNPNRMFGVAAKALR